MLSSSGRPSLNITRRDVLSLGFGALTAAGLSRARALPVSMSGESDSRLAGYDRLMTDFMREFRPPGASLAVSRFGKLVYARGFGLADVERGDKVTPASLFRIASLSKTFTATAVMRLADQNKLRLEDRVYDIVALSPYFSRGGTLDPKLRSVTVRQCLQHTGGWDRGKNLDPMSSLATEEISREMGVPMPIHAEDVVRYMFGRPLDFEPGTRFAYSNFGYCVLGRVIERASRMSYADYVARNVLAPLGLTRMRQGRNLLRQRAPDEVRYYDARRRAGRAISGPDIGRAAPFPYGVEGLETMDANGGWIASPAILVKYLDAFNDIGKCKILGERSLRAMLARPSGAPGMDNGKPSATYYGCGLYVRPVDEKQGRFTKWHDGVLAGTSTFMLAREDGLNWAVAFNSDADSRGKEFGALIDGPLHDVANTVREWPDLDLYPSIAL